jgi:hypothetical protein
MLLVAFSSAKRLADNACHPNDIIGPKPLSNNDADRFRPRAIGRHREMIWVVRFPAPATSAQDRKAKPFSNADKG